MTIEEIREALEANKKQQADLTKMLKEEEAKAEAEKQKKLADEKETRKAHVISLMEEAEKALQEYTKDYGPLVRHTDDDDFFPYYLFHNFLF